MERVALATRIATVTHVMFVVLKRYVHNLRHRRIQSHANLAILTVIAMVEFVTTSTVCFGVCKLALQTIVVLQTIAATLFRELKKPVCLLRASVLLRCASETPIAEKKNAVVWVFVAKYAKTRVIVLRGVFVEEVSASNQHQVRWENLVPVVFLVNKVCVVTISQVKRSALAPVVVQPSGVALQALPVAPTILVTLTLNASHCKEGMGIFV